MSLYTKQLPWLRDCMAHLERSRISAGVWMRTGIVLRYLDKFVSEEFERERVEDKAGGSITYAAIGVIAESV